jgi:DNA-binding MarR family transcriptional regulator
MMSDERVRTPGAAFLLSQLGGHSSRIWKARLERIGLEPREVMLFRHVALTEGQSQRELALAIGLPASRVVALVDRLEARGWIERQTSSRDRRARALYLTDAGREMLNRIMAVSAEHEAELTRGLDPAQRELLIGLLLGVAASHGLVEGVHPGFADRGADQTLKEASGGSPPRPRASGSTAR